jgi:hypothetical protein
MRRLFGLTGVMLLVVVSAAWAGDLEGKVQSVDTPARVIVLDDGTRLSAAEGLSLDRLQEGIKVKLSYEEREGTKIVTAFEVVD